MEFIVEKPRLYVTNSNAIAMSVHRLDPVVRKLLYFVASWCKTDDVKNMKLVIKPRDLMQRIGLDDGGNQYSMLRNLADRSLNATMTIEMEDGSWSKRTWFSRFDYDEKEGLFTAKLNAEIYDYVLDLKERFAVFPLEQVIKLSGRHSLKLYEMIMSQHGNEGKNGNKPNCWFLKFSIDDYRKRMGLLQNEYQRTGDLRTRVIDAPVEEINNADIGLFVKVDYFRRGTRLIAIQFNVERLKHDEPKPVAPATEKESEDVKLITANQEYYNERLAFYQAQNSMKFLSDEVKKDMDRDSAIKDLKDHLKKKKAT